jgi:hypothetical protein
VENMHWQSQEDAKAKDKGGVSNHDGDQVERGSRSQMDVVH